LATWAGPKKEKKRNKFLVARIEKKNKQMSERTKKKLSQYTQNAVKYLFTFKNWL